MRCFILSAILVLVAACSRGGEGAVAEHGEGAVIHPATGVVSITGPGAVTTAFAVKNGRILATGTAEELAKRFPKASVDRTIESQVIVPGLIDPHVDVMPGALQYNLPLTPPWPMATPNGMRAGIGTREGLLAEVATIETSMPPGQPAVIYGYHNLVYGDLMRAVRDSISTTRPLVIWHYSSHDFYLNTAAISRAGFTPDLAKTFHGVDLDANGELTGWIYKGAAVSVLEAFAGVLLALASVTLDAARAIGLEARIGSIEAGKRADFTILGANPLNVAAERWTGSPIWGVVLAGEKHSLGD